MLEALHLTKSYGTRRAVDDLSLRVERGETLGLLGPNGAGKSTTVAMLCGLVAPDRGEVRVGDGDDAVVLAGDAGPAKRRIGVVPQEISLYENLSAARNLELFGALHGLAGAALAGRVRAALESVGLADRARDKPQAFSGGMKRRLNIAAALVHDPDVVILDEPTVGVDPQSRNAIFDHLEALAAAGKALVYTTHYMEEAERLCDRLVIVDHGQVVASGTLASLAAKLPATGQVEVEVASAVDETTLQTLRRHFDRLAVSADRRVLRTEVRALARDATALLAVLDAAGHVPLRIASERPGLEDVFLALTGRQLRDSTPAP